MLHPQKLRRVSIPAVLLVSAVAAVLLSPVASAQPAANTGSLADTLAQQVVIHRDEWGVPHIDGETDAAVVFGSAWAQCEDHFFQLEDTYIKALGRYAEINGEAGFQSDLEVELFELVATSKRDIGKLPPEIKRMAEAFAAGYNYFLAKNPQVTPRLIERMEPFHVLAFERFMILGRLLGAAHAPRRDLGPLAEEIAASLGSNQWAVGPSKTKNGTTMLFINPHQPWYGSGMFTEMHVHSREGGDDGWNFSGTMYPGAPFPTAGFNERLGWAYTVNEADISDVYRLTFDHPEDPLLYRYGDGYRKAEEWTAEIAVKTDQGMEQRTVGLRKSHYGPIIGRASNRDAGSVEGTNDQYLAVKVPRLYDGSRMVQALAQAKAKTFQQWYAAASMQQLQTFNTMYADADGNIFYLYNGTVARRATHKGDARNRSSIDWTKPVDGSDPELEWGPFHPLDELPQILNPPSDFLQNCNSTPFTTTDAGNPSLLDFPDYMVEDKYDDKRRAKMSRLLLRQANELTLDDFAALAYDTTLYWPLIEIPRLKRNFERLDQELREQVRPYFEHLLDWDKKSSIESTQATLAVEWYEQLYGRGYPVETLKPEFLFDIEERFRALVRAAERLEGLYGSWQVPYGDVHRLQRHANQADRNQVPFDDSLPSLPLAGVRGPLGVAFTVYHTPPMEAADGKTARKLQYATTGASYMAVYEFGERVEARSYLHYGQSHDPSSPHFFDQAQLLSEQRFKPAWFYWQDVVAHTEKAYHPGQEELPGLTAARRFLSTWNSRDEEAWAASLHFPHARPVAESHRVWQTARDYTAEFDYHDVIVSGWDHTEFAELEVVHHGEDKAHIAAEWVRYDKDGQELRRNLVSYIASRRDQGWGIQARFGVGAPLPEGAQRRQNAEAALEVVKKYMATFNQRDPEAWAATLNYPHLRIASPGLGTASAELVVHDTEAEFAANMDFDVFAERFSWHHSEWDHIEAIQVAEKAVTVALRFSRYDKEGTKLSTFETLYLVTEENGRWGIRARSSFAP